MKELTMHAPAWFKRLFLLLIVMETEWQGKIVCTHSLGGSLLYVNYLRRALFLLSPQLVTPTFF